MNYQNRESDLILLPPLNRNSVSRNDGWLVVEETQAGWKIIESQPNRIRAQHAAGVLGMHERHNGRETVYKAVYAPAS